jgi:hypothetical protein
MSLFQIYPYFFHIRIFLTVSKSKNKDKIRKVYDLNVLDTYFKGIIFKIFCLYMRLQ